MSCSTLLLASFVMLVYGKACAGLKSCDDCVPYTSCPMADHRAQTDRSRATIKLLRDAYCGLYNKTIVKVCCSDFGPQITLKGRFRELDEDTDHPNIRLLPDTCGRYAQDRIVGGEVAGLYEFPWMVLIGYPDGDKVDFQCSGSLINERYVVTAAHCVKNREIKGVRIGEFDLRYTIDCQYNVCENNLQDKEVEKSKIHENYEGFLNYSNDIALLRLKTSVDFSFKNADAICLPITKNLQEQSITHRRATVAGWGITELGRESEVLRKVIIPIYSKDACEDYYGEAISNDSNQFCAGEYKKDSCRGDSGGPLMLENMYKDNLKYVQYGIVSNGPDKCGSHSPGLYTDIRKYVNWILDNLEAW